MKLEDYNKTCSVTDLKDDSITFVRDYKYLRCIESTNKHVCVVIPRALKEFTTSIPKNVSFVFVDSKEVDYVFTKIHNKIYEGAPPLDNIISDKCVIDKTAVIGVEGIKLANRPDGSKLQFKHTGNIIIEDDVEIGACVIIHRASMTSTVIKRGVKIAAQVNVGHNAMIGEDTVIATRALVGGSTFIGKNCWIGLNVLIKNGISICDNVIIGMGSLVVKDITKPGVYFGSPCEYKKPYVGDWNF